MKNLISFFSNLEDNMDAVQNGEHKNKFLGLILLVNRFNKPQFSPQGSPQFSPQESLLCDKGNSRL